MRLRSLALLAAALAAHAAAHATETCTAIADARTGRVLMQRGDCATHVTPASTFKIAISLMGYDAGFLKDQHTPALPWREGYVDWKPSWREPTDPARWMQESVVWYSQRVTQALGKERFAAYARQFGYGNADVAGDARHDGLTMSWIGSSLKISPLEQLAFLGKVVNRQLGVSAHAYDMTSAILRYDGGPAGWDLHGKTGASSGYGWYVGWASRGARTLVFARLVRHDATKPAGLSTGVWARDGFLRDFPALAAPLLK